MAEPLCRQCKPKFREDKEYPKWLPETEIQEEPGSGSRIRDTHTQNQISKSITDTVRSLNAISELGQTRVSTQDHIATNSITVRCNWRSGFRSLVAGSGLDQIVGSNFPTGSDHNISQRYYRQHHPSLSLYVTDQTLHHHTTTVRITGRHIVNCAHIIC